MAKCDCYYQHGMKFLCYGTKEREECSCGGDTSKCDFYPEKRKPKVQKMANEKRLIDANAIHYCFYDLDNYHSFSAVTDDEINEMPTVDAVEVVHGRWEEHPRMTGYLRCSKCHDANIWEDWLTDGKWNYCPNCGVKMDGDSNG